MTSSLERNDISLLSDIIYQIYSIEDTTEMRGTFLKLLKVLVPYTKASFYLASKDVFHALDNPVGINLNEKELQRYLDGYEDEDYTRWIFFSAKNMAYRETDLFSESSRVQTKYYKEIYFPSNIHYSAQLCLSYHEVFVGIVSLYRPKDDGDFTDDQIFLLDLFKDHLAYRLYCCRFGQSDRKSSPDAINNAKQSYTLTNREAEILGHLFRGHSSEIICGELNISNHTLKKHISNLYKKMDVKSRGDLLGKLYNPSSFS